MHGGSDGGPSRVRPLLTRVALSAVPLPRIIAAVLVPYATALMVALWSDRDKAIAGFIPLTESIGNWTFFSVAITGTLVGFLWAQRRLCADFPALAAALALPPEVARDAADDLHRVPAPVLHGNLALGITLGLAHDVILDSTTARLLGLSDVSHSPLRLLFSLSTVALWTLTFAIATQLISSARQLSRLVGAHLEPGLGGNPAAHRLGVIASRSIVPTLILVAALPLLIFDSEPRWSAVVPGAVMSLALIVVLFLAPLGGLRARVEAFKREQIAAVDRALASIGPLGRDAPRDIERNRARELASLLSLRRELQAISPWPVGASVFGRVLLYGIIPPLTWIAAAMVEFSLAGLL